MNTMVRTLLGATILSTAFGSAVTAQSTFAGTDVAENRNEDLLEAIEDDAERDLDRFGNQGRQQGFTGSFALRGTSKSGNTDSADIGIGTDLSYLQGLNGYELKLSYNYGEEDGDRTDESLFYGLQYTREFSPVFYGFAKLQGSVDSFSAFETDTFASIGAGYRVLNTAETQWAIQAGPGYRFAELDDVADGDVDEAAFGFTSNYAQRIGVAARLTNDTDIIASDADTVVLNDLALSVSMSDALALRTSLLTEYHTEPQEGFDDTDSTLGVSLVYAFN